MSARTSLVCTTVLLSAYFAAGCKKAATSRSVEPLETPAWHEVWNEPPYMLLHRTESDDGEVLLLRALKHAEALEWRYKQHTSGRDSVIYRYTRGATQLTPVGVEVWESATGTICDDIGPCGAAAGMSRAMRENPFGADRDTHALQFKGTDVRTSGKTVLCVQGSPKNDLSAVLSTTGKYRRVQSLMPFIGGGGGTARGRRYHQVFNNADGSAVGQPVVLRGTSKADDVRATWSEDGRYVIYRDSDYKHLWIVTVPTPAGDRK